VLAPLGWANDHPKLWLEATALLGKLQTGLVLVASQAKDAEVRHRMIARVAIHMIALELSGRATLLALATSEHHALLARLAILG
jgi:hypothetical protein